MTQEERKQERESMRTRKAEMAEGKTAGERKDKNKKEDSRRERLRRRRESIDEEEREEERDNVREGGDYI